MARKRKRRSDPFAGLTDAAIGTARLGVTLPVGSVITSKGVAKLPAAQRAAMAPVQTSYGEIAGYARFAVTAQISSSLLRSLKRVKKKRKRK